MTHHKHLSYFWNTEKAKAKIKENKIYRKAKDETSAFHVFGHVLFSLIIVATAAVSLNIVEKGVNEPKQTFNKVMGVQIVLAAENINQAELTAQSHAQLNIKPNEAFTFNLSFENTGMSTWTKETVYLKSISTSLKFKHEYWPDPYHPAQLIEESVAPGETGTFKFALKAPKKFSNHKGDFLLVNDNVMIKGGKVEIEMNVVEDPANYKSATKIVTETTNPKLNVCNLKLNIASVNSSLDNETCVEKFALNEDGPDVRVGLFYTDKMISIKNTAAWQIYDDNNKLLASIPAETIITLNYIDAKKEFAFDLISKAKTVRSLTNLTLKNFNQGIWEITTLEDRPSWNKTINYNKFTGNLALKFNDYKERVWLIETLPLEKYLKGLKESSNPDPIEYHKAQVTAARTYALYHVNKFKIEDSLFDLYTDEKDQVYKGYAAEQIMKNQVKAVEDTRGVIATFDNSVIVAYYSARSGGQTITHKSIPYLKSVKTPYTAGKGLYGHAIGMDQVDAKNRAEKDSWTYDQILKYYYTGIKLEKIY
ncbi:SpoIID/LytB domain-containing protein [Candidatus Kuenenbacteria bacterium]|nr:SpoIID/LytB domain-containing protein [Candidatus Kuenenbacteria bacterium]